MRSTSSWLLAAFAATLVILAGVGSAAANRLSVSQRTFSATWIPQEEPVRTENITIEETFGLQVICEMQLSGSFHSSTMVKTAGALIGYVNGASFGGTCPARMLRETLPWHVRYRNFTGVLPTIASVGISVIGLAIRIPIGGTECLVRSEATNPARFNFNLNEVGRMRTTSADATATIPGTGGCAFSTFRLKGTGTAGSVTVRLI